MGVGEGLFGDFTVQFLPQYTQRRDQGTGASHVEMFRSGDNSWWPRVPQIRGTHHLLLPWDLAPTGVRGETGRRMRFGGRVSSGGGMGQEALICAGVQVKSEPRTGAWGRVPAGPQSDLGKMYDSPRTGKRDPIPPRE